MTEPQPPSELSEPTTAPLIEVGTSANEYNIVTPEFTEIFRWAGALTTEQAEEPDYYETTEVQILKNRLTLLKGQLVAILGLQGAGKTALRQHLAGELENVLSVKWTGHRDIIRALAEARKFEDPSNPESYPALLVKALNKKLGFVKLPSKGRYTGELARIFDLDTNNERIRKLLDALYDWQLNRLDDPDALIELETGLTLDLLPLLEVAFTPRELTRLEAAFAQAAIGKLDTVLLDLPDFDRQTKSQALRDLKELQTWWEGFNFEPGSGYNLYGESPNLVLFWQQETWKDDHFFMGKFTKFTLRPFTVTELVDLYLTKFGSTWPFEPGALEALASLSRGVPRWFKKYAGTCLDRLLLRGTEIVTSRDIETWITLDQLVEDMNRELVGIFPRSKKHRRFTVIVLQTLRERGPTAQLDLARLFFGPDKAAEMEASRFFSKLEDAGYVVRSFEGRRAFINVPET